MTPETAMALGVEPDIEVANPCPTDWHYLAGELCGPRLAYIPKLPTLPPVAETPGAPLAWLYPPFMGGADAGVIGGHGIFGAWFGGGGASAEAYAEAHATATSGVEAVVRYDTPDVAAVPVPATGVLLVAALLAFCLTRLSKVSDN